MAKDGESYDDLFKSLITAFFPNYLKLFHPDLLPILNADEADWSNTELRFPEFGQKGGPPKKQRRFADIVAKVPYRDPANPPFKGTKYFVLDIEPEKGSVGDLRPRMSAYRLGLKMAHPDAHVVVTGLYLDRAMNGMGVDWFMAGDLEPIPLPSQGKAKGKAKAGAMPLPAKTVNAEAFSWSYVALKGLDAEHYILMAKDVPLVAALVGFMRIKKECRLELLGEAILAIDGYDLEVELKNLLARGLLTGLNLNEDEQKRFEDFVNQHPKFRRAGSVVKTWYDRGKDDGRVEGRVEGRMLGVQDTVLRLIARRFGPSAKVEKLVSKLSENQLQDLAEALLDSSKTLEDLGLAKQSVNGAVHG